MFGKFFLLLFVVFIAVILDFATGKVSNYLILTGLLAGFVVQFIWGKDKISSVLLGAIVPVAVLFIVFMIGGIGAGDVKLFAVIGVFLGVRGVFTCIILAFIVGAVISIGKILIYRNSIRYLDNLYSYISLLNQTKKIQLYKKEKANTIHFTLPILISVVVYMGGMV